MKARTPRLQIISRTEVVVTTFHKEIYKVSKGPPQRVGSGVLSQFPKDTELISMKVTFAEEWLACVGTTSSHKDDNRT